MTMASKFEIWKLKMNHPWHVHVAKTRFVTFLSTELLNSLEKSSWLQKRGVVPHNGATCPTSTQLLRLL